MRILPKIKPFITTACVAAAMICGIFIGYYAHFAPVNVITHNVTILKENYHYFHDFDEKTIVEAVPVKVPVIREIERVVEKEVIVNDSFKEWADIGELTNWLDSVSTKIWVINGSTDRDYFARRLQKEAYGDGYFLSCQLLSGGSLYGKEVSPYKTNHMGNLAIVKNGIYFIELQQDSFSVDFIGSLK